MEGLLPGVDEVWRRYNKGGVKLGGVQCRRLSVGEGGRRLEKVVEWWIGVEWRGGGMERGGEG